MVSIWEKQSFLHYDAVIVGAGITGLSAAASLKETDPSLKVAVLERGVLPTGASTKNAGFACFGSVSELLNDINALGEDGMTQLVEKRWTGLKKTEKRLGIEVIDLQINGGYELILEDRNDLIDQIGRVNKLLLPIFNQNVFHQNDKKIPNFGFGKTHHLIENHLEGQLDTGKLIDSLWHYCSVMGIRVYTGCEALNFEDDGSNVRIQCKKINFQTKKLGICTNAFAKQLVHQPLDLIPGRGMVMSIRPGKPLNFKGTFHYREGYYYFRDYYGRLIFGGGRDLDIKNETTIVPGVNLLIKKKLLEDLASIILPNQDFEIELEWSGIMAFGKHKSPIIKKLTENIALGVRLGGMGVAIGSLVGEEVARNLLE